MSIGGRTRLRGGVRGGVNLDELLLRAELVVPHVVGAAEDVVTARQEAERERLALERRGRVGAGEASEVVKNKEVELGSVHRRPVVLRRDQRAGAGARHPRL